jgi:hypothetical protein
MEWFARGALHRLRRHLTAVGRVKRIVVRHCALPVWRSLVAYGSMYTGIVEPETTPRRVDRDSRGHVEPGSIVTERGGDARSRRPAAADGGALR